MADRIRIGPPSSNYSAIVDDKLNGSFANVSAKEWFIFGSVDPGLPDNVGTNFGYAGASGDLRRYPFSITSGTAEDVADHPSGTPPSSSTAHQDASNGYMFGNQSPGGVNRVDKFPFSQPGGVSATIASGSFVPFSSPFVAGQGHSDPAGGNGYTSGGNQTNVNKWPFSIGPGGSASDIGEVIAPHYRSGSQGASSNTVAYLAGGQGPPVGTPYHPAHDGTDIIEKFPFAQTSGSTTDIGELANQYGQGSAHASDGQSGWVSCGDGLYAGPGNPNPDVPGVSADIITKYPFAITSGFSTDVGRLANRTFRVAGATSGATAGFHGNAGAGRPWPTPQENIQKFPWAATSGTTTDVGELGIASQDGVVIND